MYFRLGLAKLFALIFLQTCILSTGDLIFQKLKIELLASSIHGPLNLDLQEKLVNKEFHVMFYLNQSELTYLQT